MDAVERGGNSALRSLRQRRKASRAAMQLEMAERRRVLRNGGQTEGASKEVVTDAQRLQRDKMLSGQAELSLVSLVLLALRDEETPFDRMTRVRKSLLVLNLIQIAFAAALFAFAALQSSADDTFTNVFAAVLAFVTAIVGVWAATARSEFLARLFFVAEVWLLCALTTYMFVASDQFAAQGRLCATAAGDLSVGSVGSDSHNCKATLELLRAKLAVSVTLVIFTLISAIVALDLNDSINDYAAMQCTEEALVVGHKNHFMSHYTKREHLVSEEEKRWHLRVYGAGTAGFVSPTAEDEAMFKDI